MYMLTIVPCYSGTHNQEYVSNSSNDKGCDHWHFSHFILWTKEPGMTMITLVVGHNNKIIAIREGFMHNLISSPKSKLAIVPTCLSLTQKDTLYPCNLDTPSICVHRHIWSMEYSPKLRHKTTAVPMTNRKAGNSEAVSRGFSLHREVPRVEEDSL